MTSVRVPGAPGQVAVVGQPGVPPGHCSALTPQQIQAAKQARAGQMVAKAGIPQQHPEPVEYYGHHPNAKSQYDSVILVTFPLLSDPVPDFFIFSFSSS